MIALMLKVKAEFSSFFRGDPESQYGLIAEGS